jgi:hypothetical protein
MQICRTKRQYETALVLCGDQLSNIRTHQHKTTLWFLVPSKKQHNIQFRIFTKIFMSSNYLKLNVCDHVCDRKSARTKTALSGDRIFFVECPEFILIYRHFSGGVFSNSKLLSKRSIEPPGGPLFRSDT